MTTTSSAVSAAACATCLSADAAGARVQDQIARSERTEAEEALLTLARCLGRQAARQQLARGRPLWEVVASLVLGALIIGLMSYAGLLHGGPR